MMVTTDPFLFLLEATTLLRGLGAGAILGVELITLPVRRRLDLAVYAIFMRAHYRGAGVTVYALITILGLILTLAVAVWTAVRGDAVAVSGPIYASLVATIFGFAGTAGAYPRMRKLWSTADNDTSTVSELLDKFAYWSVWSAASHIVAFIFICTALANG